MPHNTWTRKNKGKTNLLTPIFLDNQPLEKQATKKRKKKIG
jgi:hypothetical protein